MSSVVHYPIVAIPIQLITSTVTGLYLDSTVPPSNLGQFLLGIVDPSSGTFGQ